MPSRRKKPKHANKKITTPNHHSSPTIQRQGNSHLKSLKEGNGSLTPFCLSYSYLIVEEEKSKIKEHSLSAGAAVSANHSKMESSFNATTLQETQKVDSLSEDKEVVVQVSADGAIPDEKETRSEENRELVGSAKVEDKEHVSESVVESFDPIVSSPNDFGDSIKAAQVDNILISDAVELELKEEQEKGCLSSEPQETDGVSAVVGNHEVKGLDYEETELPPSEDNDNELSSVSGNWGLIETEVVETIKDMPVAIEKESEEQPNGDVPSKEILETTVPNSDESDNVPLSIVGGTEAIPKGTQTSWVPSTDEKVEELLDVQESSCASVKESLQPLANIHDAESTSASVQDKTEVPRSTEHPTIVSVTQRNEYTSWRSCCGLFEILRRGDR